MNYWASGQGQLRGHDAGRASHRGGNGNARGRGGRVGDSGRAEIAARRSNSAQVGSESTDDLLPAPELDADLQYLARWVLNKEDFTGFRTQKMARNFVHSLLVNLSNHHSVDVSGLLLDLASEKGRPRLREILERKMYINAANHKECFSFQYVVLPLIGVLTREHVCQSALVEETVLIYTEVYRVWSEFLHRGVFSCMNELIDNGSMNDTSLAGVSWRSDPSLLQAPSLLHAMLAIVRLVYQVIKRVPGAKTEMEPTVRTAEFLASKCIEKADTSETASFLAENLKRECQRLRYLISTSTPSVLVPVTENDTEKKSSHDVNIAHLAMNYDPPGSLSKEGSRNDNDHASIKDINVVPTRDELTCIRQPFLPSNDVPGAPHHLPPGWARLLDTHFRLNREDMIDQLRRGVNTFIEAWRNVGPDRRGALLSRRELRQILGEDVAVYAYDNVEFLGTNAARNLNGTIKIAFDQPSVLKNQSKDQREVFWQRSKRRLMTGSLVCFIFPENDEEDAPTLRLYAERKYQLCLGVIRFRDDREMAMDPKRAIIHISLTNTADIYRLASAAKSGDTPGRECLMVQSMGGFFEAYRPVLQALQKCEPGEMPFGRYLAPTDDQKTDDAVVNVDPPLYSQAPSFEFDLTVLLNAPVTCHLDVQDPASCEQAVAALRAHSMLDDTQSQALIDALSREVALISGPPGTGKTKIGVDLMRVLLHNADRMKCGPILCICYTNHALDQFLEHLLDQGVTSLVRIGGRSQSERLQQYSLQELMKAYPKPFAVRHMLHQVYKEWDVASVRLEEVEKELRRQRPPLKDLLRHCALQNQQHYSQLRRGKHGDESSEKSMTIEQKYQRWSSGIDLTQMEKENRRLQKKWNKDNKKATQKRRKVLRQAEEMGLNDQQTENALADLDELPDPPVLHEIPETNRPIAELKDADIWTMSMQERTRVRDFWTEKVQDEVRSRHAAIMDIIQRLSKAVTIAHDEVRRNILRKAQVIGMTTNGAARFQSIVGAISPRIIICEEAGEVLESHILAALSGSTQHLILIGDHLQLRPQIATYELSSDSYQGKQYNLDRSLFERLVTTGKVPSSLLTTQRRMRPEICDLVRHTLYPSLIDGERVLSYPDVYGMATNLFFMDHRHPEDSRDQYGIQSYANTFEVEMVQGLVQHLFKNGYQYSSIAVLTPYLGQLSRLRDKLSDLFQVILDERDQEDLDAMMDGKLTTVAPSKVKANSRQVTLRTIDNYQGEEADIIIISLVRSDTREDHLGSSSTIGFLKSPNRTNVLLSRARHGMYLIGNSPLMDQSRNGLWPQIMAELAKTDRIGDGFPVRCRNHPEAEFLACMPDDFATYAPNGGCTRQCDHELSCGHICTKLCHWNDKDHLNYKCEEPCPRVHPECNHPCRLRCGQECGDCSEPVGELRLPCDHVLPKAYCFQVRDPSKARCKEKVVRQLVHCEHEHTMDCHKDVNKFKCPQKCGVLRPCGHACTRNCHDCHTASLVGDASSLQEDGSSSSSSAPAGVIERTNHGACKEKCGKLLSCGHACNSTCHSGEECPPCKQNCLTACAHTSCKHACNTRCTAVCLEPCTWSCSHQGTCSKPCGAPCTRLPCDLRCDKTLSCGHRCPSVCGEICPSERFCVECKSVPSVMEMIVNADSQEKLGDVNVDKDPLVVLHCGHALTLSSLDRHIKMGDYYEQESETASGAARFVDTKTLPNIEVSAASCPVCAVAVVGVQRYGRRLKHRQLVRNLKHFMLQQNAKLMEADTQFAQAVDTMERNVPNFLHTLSTLLELNPTTTVKQTTAKRGRLGCIEVEGDLLPNSDFLSLFMSYDIHPKQEKAWMELVMPAQKVMKLFDDIRENAGRSPALRLYEASVFKFRETTTTSTTTDAANVEIPGEKDTNTTKDPEATNDENNIQRLMDECARECFLSPDRQSGSSYVRAIQGRLNLLQSVLDAAFRAMDTAGAATGWYWLVDDLMKCWLMHGDMLRKATIQGGYPKMKLCIEANLAQLYSMRFTWLTYRSLSTSSSADETNADSIAGRQEVAQKHAFKSCMDFVTLVNEATFPEDQDVSINVLRHCRERVYAIKTHLEMDAKVAMGTRSTALGLPDRFNILRIHPTHMFAEDHWRRCDNGHSDIAEHENGSSTCRECHAHFV